MYSFFFFFFNDTATTEIYTLSLHDALPIFGEKISFRSDKGMKYFLMAMFFLPCVGFAIKKEPDRKSTRLNSSHQIISYAVFCLKKKKQYNPVSTSTIVPVYTLSTQEHALQY